MASNEPDPDADPDPMELENFWRSQIEHSSLTRLPGPDPDDLNAALSDEAKAILHADAATCRRMMDARRISYPTGMQPRQFTAGLVSATGRFVWPDVPGSRTTNKGGHAKA